MNKKRGGGVALYLHNKFCFTEINTYSKLLFDVCESCIIEVESNQRPNIIIASLYKPPEIDICLFGTAISKLLEEVTSSNKTLFIAGDTNIDLLKYGSNKKISNFLDSILSFGLLPSITLPTRLVDKSATLIDNIFTNRSNSQTQSFIIFDDLSDHLPILLNSNLLNNKFTATNTSSQEKRIFSACNFQKFDYLLSNIDWYPLIPNNLIFKTDSPNETYGIFFNKFYTTFDAAFPMKTFTSCTKRNNSKLTPPWISKSLLRACHKKSRLLKIYKKNKTPQAKNNYIIYKNKLKQIIRNEEKLYYAKEFNSKVNNIKATWKLINEVVNKTSDLPNTQSCVKLLNINGTKTSNSRAIAEHLNNYFTNIGPSLAEKIPHSSADHVSFLPPSNINSLFLNPTSQAEVVNTINSIENKSSFGPDEIPVTVLKASANHISQVLSLLINHSFEEGIFPDSLKIAKIFPIFKSGSPLEASNYRPISLLNSFSKVYEKLIYNRLQLFLNKNDILYKGQFGFRKFHSTEAVLLNYVDNISEAIESNKYVISIFLDFAKAFDTVDHKILLSKLAHYGIRGPALNLLHSYLTDRYQYVQILNHQSAKLKITHGVPQGSVLGPFLFLIYINDIGHLSTNSPPLLFADDTTLSYSNPSLFDLTNIVNSDLIKFQTWLSTNKLSLNITKTNYILFQNHKTFHDNPKITINDLPIKRVTTVKLLGVEIDHKLSWKTHIATLQKKVAAACFMIRKIRHKINTQTALLLYDTTIATHLSYCTGIWGNACTSYISPINVLIKRTLRSCLLIKTNSNYEVIKHAKKLLVPEIFSLRVATIIYTFFNHPTQLPSAVIKMFKPVSLVHNHATRLIDCYGLFRPPCTNSTRNSTIRFAGPLIWNNLPHAIKSSSTISVFKKDYKQLLLNNLLACQ